MDQQTFDQGMTGWRELASRRCHKAAANLIRDWRRHHAEAGTILFWHEGQMRANANDYRRAITLFAKSRKRPGQEMAEAWNIYVDGSIAFLRGNRTALDRARTRLAATARPADFNPVDSDGKSIPITWPPNLSVLEALRRCWGQTYITAYSCRTSRSSRSTLSENARLA